MTTPREPLLTDEEIEKIATDYGELYRQFPASMFITWTVGAEYARSIYETDRAALLARIAELEAMVPRWCSEDDLCDPALNEWDELTCDEESGLTLMVPPIPLPEPARERKGVMNFCDVCGKPQGFGRCEHCAERERHRIAEMDVARRLARYDEAIRLLRKNRSADGWTFEDEDAIDEFLADEPKGDKG